MIQEISNALGGVSDAVVYALLAVGVAQIAVQIWALVDLARRNQVMGERKWLWALVIIILSNLALGAILYLLIGRTGTEVAQEPDVPRVAIGDRTARAVDALYGPRDDGGEQ